LLRDGAFACLIGGCIRCGNFVPAMGFLKVSSARPHQAPCPAPCGFAVARAVCDDTAGNNRLQ